MNPRRIPRILAFARACAAVTFALLLFAPDARAQAPRYTITDLGTLGGASSGAFGINASGQVTGWALNAAGVQHAFLYSGGVMTDIDTLNSPLSFGLSINNAGQVVGDAFYTSNPSNGSYGFLYSGGAMSALSNTVEAHAINNSGQITGTMIGTSGQVAFLDTAGTFQQLGTLVTVEPPFFNTSQGDALNNLGQVAGQSAISTNIGPNPHAFLYTSGTGLIDLNNRDTTQNLRADTGQALGINDSGQVVGVIDNEAFYYNGSNTTLLPDLGGGEATPYAINNAGQIVGDSFTASDADHAALWIGGTLYDLNNLVTNLASSGFSTLDAALDINNSGTIVGEGVTSDGSTHAFEAQLVPEPGAAALLLLAAPACLAIRRRERAGAR